MLVDILFVVKFILNSLGMNSVAWSSAAWVAVLFLAIAVLGLIHNSEKKWR